MDKKEVDNMDSYRKDLQTPNVSLEQKPVESDDDKCRCGKEATKELHSCPYNADVNNDDTPCCTCCDECVHECSMDI